MKKILIACFLLLLTDCAFSQITHLQDTTETAMLSERVTKMLFKKLYPEAIDELQKYWPADKTELDNLKELTEKTMELAIKRYGEFTSYELFSVKTANDLVREETYVIKMEYHVLRIKFFYYKSMKGWLVNNFTWDDKIGELLKD